MGQKLNPEQERRNRHGRSPLPWFALGLSGLCIGLFYLFGPLSEILLFDRAAIANGEVWRLVTGHLVHVSGNHMLLNVAAAFPMAWLMEKGLGVPPARLLSIFLLSILAIDLWLWFGLPDLAWYSGLSAYLNTLYALLMLLAWRRSGHWIFLAFLAGDAFKIAFEGLTHTSLFSSLAVAPVPSAHAVGLAVGLVIFFFSRPYSNVASSKQQPA